MTLQKLQACRVDPSVTPLTKPPPSSGFFLTPSDFLTNSSSEKQNECLRLIHFLPSAPPSWLQWHVLCVTASCHVDVSVRRNPPSGRTTPGWLSETPGSIRGCFLIFCSAYILHCVRRLYRVQSDSEGLSWRPHTLIPCQLTPTTFPFLHGEICITAIATIASISPRKEEMEDLGWDLT